MPSPTEEPLHPDDLHALALLPPRVPFKEGAALMRLGKTEAFGAIKRGEVDAYRDGKKLMLGTASIFRRARRLPRAEIDSDRGRAIQAAKKRATA